MATYVHSCLLYITVDVNVKLSLRISETHVEELRYSSTHS